MRILWFCCSSFVVVIEDLVSADPHRFFGEVSTRERESDGSVNRKTCWKLFRWATRSFVAGGLGVAHGRHCCCSKPSFRRRPIPGRGADATGRHWRRSKMFRNHWPDGKFILIIYVLPSYVVLHIIVIAGEHINCQPGIYSGPARASSRKL